MIYDIAIVGGGPAGYTAALEAARYNKKTVLFERDEMGGTCLNEGCIPLKSFLHVSGIYRRSLVHGFAPSEPDMGSIRETAKKNIGKLQTGLLHSLKAAGVETVNAEVKLIEKDSRYRIITDKGNFMAEDVIAAPGSEQVIPPISGLMNALKRKKAVTSRDFFDMQDIPDEILILGAGAIGIEIACFYTDLGRHVTLIDDQERILPEVDDDILRFYLEQLGRRGMHFILGVDVCEVDSEDKVCLVYQRNDEIDEVSGDCLVIATGRRPVDRFNDIEGVHICGDASGPPMLAHSAMQEAAAAVHRILGEERQIDPLQTPRVIYSSPELSWIGAGEDKSTGSTSRKSTMDYSSRYVIDADGGKGCIKVTKDAEKIVGCQIVGDGGSELIAFVLSDGLDKTIYPHPSISEILREIL